MTSHTLAIVFGAALVAGCNGLKAVFEGTGQGTKYSIEHDGSTIFLGGEVSAFVGGEWATQSAGTLKLVDSSIVKGTDPDFGAFTAQKLTWTATKTGTPFVTTASSFDDGLTVTFNQQWPKGAEGTSLVKANVSGLRSHLEVIANWPALSNNTLQNTVSWAGSFVGAQVNQGTDVTGPTGGPTVFFDAADATLGTVLVLSPLDHFKATSAGPGKMADGTTEAFAPGTAGTITSLPAGFSHTFVLKAGSASGITSAIGEWGAMMQAYYKTYKVTDVTLTNIGYQTDNGAGYVFCRPGSEYDNNCNELLIDELKQLKQNGVPMGYLSFQGAGSSTMLNTAAGAHELQQGAGAGAGAVVGGGGGPSPPGPPKVQAAPWCVNEWGPDLNMSQRQHGSFPMDEGAFQKALGVPLQLYAPYFCPESKYFSRNDPASQWVSVVSDNSLPGCSFYGFQDVTPDQSRKFYDWFFEKGVAVGMKSFEPDFMNQNYNCVPEFIESATNASIWQHGMTDAALAKNLTVQWCYAAPTDVLNSLEMPALTNFRVSNDFCYGESWKVGVSSLIVWAAGSAPSKDTLWTTDNGKFAVPGCQWSADHETPAAELHVVIALMTTGPVGISDLVGHTNATLARRMIREDGLLLKPSKPITTVDSYFIAGDGSAGTRTQPPGYVYTTYSGTLKAPTAWYFVSFKLTKEWGIPTADFYPPLVKGATVAYRRFDAGHSCTAGGVSSDCIHFVSVDSKGNIEGDARQPVLVAPKSDQTNVTGGTDYAPSVATVYPVCESGYVLLGELSKYVGVSANRFEDLTCTAGGLTATVVGVAGELVIVTLVKKNGNTDKSPELIEREVTIPASGSYALAEPKQSF